MTVPRRKPAPRTGGRGSGRPGLDGRTERVRRSARPAAAAPSRPPRAPRPAAASRARGRGAGGPLRSTGITSRAAVLGLVLCGLLVTLALPLRGFVEQRQYVGDLQEQVAAQEVQVSELEEAQRRWADPAYVKAQARSRLHYVMPGETQYVVLEPDEAPAPGTTVAEAGPEEDVAELRRPWFSKLWTSVEKAGQDPATADER